MAGVVGGTASKLGGGKFANGAITGAFVHMFNAEAGGSVAKARRIKQLMAGARDGYLTLEEAKALYSYGYSTTENNRLEISVDATKLTVRIAGGRTFVDGWSDYQVHGQVSLLDGKIESEMFNYEMHNVFDNPMNIIRNTATVMGYIKEGYSVGTPFRINYIGKPKVVYGF